MIRIISTPDRTPGHVRGKRGERPLQQGRSPLIFPCGKAVLEMIRVVRSGSCRSGSRIEQECSGSGSWSGPCPGRLRVMVRIRIIKVLRVRSTPDPEYDCSAAGANAASTRGRKRESAAARSRRAGTHYLSTGTTRRRDEIGDSGEDIRRSTDPGRNDRRVPMPADDGYGRRSPSSTARTRSWPPARPAAGGCPTARCES